jgi:lipopolysaccharide transport system permease protein
MVEKCPAMDRPLKEAVYTPDSELLNFGTLLRNMGRDLLASRDLAGSLLLRDINAQYRQSILGYAWALVPPLFTSLIWIFLHTQDVFGIADVGMSYVVFVICGTVLWQTFVESLNAPLRMVNSSRSMISKVNFPREALILAGMGQSLFNFLVRSLLLIGVMLWFRVDWQLGVILVPLGVLSLVMLGTAIGLFLTPLGVLYHDVGRGLGFATQALFFLTPVVYPVPKASFAGTLIELNPVTPLLICTREWLVTGSPSLLPEFAWVLAGTLALLMFAWVQFRVSMPHLIARMSS